MKLDIIWDENPKFLGTISLIFWQSIKILGIVFENAT